MNVYILRERANKNFFTKTRKWNTRIGLAEIFTDLGKARQTRKKLKDLMDIQNSKIEIVEYELIERSSL